MDASTATGIGATIAAVIGSGPIIPLDHPVIRLVYGWLSEQPLVAALLLLMVIDVLSGTFVSFARKTLSSSVSWRGMSKKAIVLLIIGVAAVLEPFAQGIPLSKLVAMFYIFTEALSILENAASAGVPLPSALVEALGKLKESQRAARIATGVTPPVRIEGNIVIDPEPKSTTLDGLAKTERKK